MSIPKFNVRKCAATGIGLVASIALMTGAALPASASEADGTIAGYTQESFVAAAAEHGIDASVAIRAWGDEDAMAQIPVASTAGVESGGISTRAAAWTKTCTYTNKNLYGAKLQSISITKGWAALNSPDGSKKIMLRSISATGSGGVGWWYESMVTSTDKFVGTNHSSYRKGLFKMADLDGATIGANIHATFLIRPDGTTSCTGGNG
ncbi:hypothetical protein [Microbacterium sp. GXF0217]